MKSEGLGWRIAKYIIITIGILIILGPLYLVVINSFKTLTEAGQDFFALPKSFYLGNFVELFSKNKYWTYVRNSVLISITSIVLVALFIPAVSYSIARNFHKRYYKFLYSYLTIGLFIPSQIIMLPIVKQMTKLNLLNPMGLILLYCTYSLTRGIFLFVGYIKAMPIEIEEAAVIDGCNTFMVYTRVVVYVIKPMIATLIIMDFLWFWNDFMLPLLILNKSPDNWTLPLFQYNFKTQYSFDYTMAFTAYLVSMMPVIIVYCFCQKYIITGLTAGAVKS